MAQVNAIGQTLTVTFLEEDGSTPRDLTGASAIDIYVTRPDLTVAVLSASVVTDGTDGAISAVTADGTLTVAGRYGFQGYAEDTDDGFTGFSGRYQLDVFVTPEVVP